MTDKAFINACATLAEPSLSYISSMAHHYPDHQTGAIVTLISILRERLIIHCLGVVNKLPEARRLALLEALRKAVTITCDPMRSSNRRVDELKIQLMDVLLELREGKL